MCLHTHLRWTPFREGPSTLAPSEAGAPVGHGRLAGSGLARALSPELGSLAHTSPFLEWRALQGLDVGGVGDQTEGGREPRPADRHPPLPQIFPLSPGSRWPSAGARPAALALQQALGQELALARRGSPEVTGMSVRLLQAVASLLSSPHGGALALSMQRSHFLACPLLRQLRQYQVRAAAPTRGVCLLPEAVVFGPLPRGPRPRLLGEGSEPGGPSSGGAGPAGAGESRMAPVCCRSGCLTATSACFCVRGAPRSPLNHGNSSRRWQGALPERRLT